MVITYLMVFSRSNHLTPNKLGYAAGTECPSSCPPPSARRDLDGIFFWARKMIGKSIGIILYDEYVVYFCVLMRVLFQDWLNHVEPLFVEKRWHIACSVIFLGCCKMVTSGESRGI